MIKAAARRRHKLFFSAVFLNSFMTSAAFADPLANLDDMFKLNDFGNFGGQDSKQSLDIDAIKARKRKVEDDVKRSLPGASAQAKNSTDFDDMDKQNQSNPALNDTFDGSEYGASNFVDTDFNKRSYQDLFKPKKADADKDFKDPDLSKRDPDFTSDGTDRDYALSLIEARRKEKACLDKKAYMDFVKPVYFLPGDWVPSGLDSVWNGGFTTPPDNGSPVPYRLNGHVDIQRGLPWQAN